MPNFFYLTLDTTQPQNPSISVEGGSAFASSQLVDVTIGTTDPETAGYQIKMWGNVDLAHDANIQATEANSFWVSFTTSKQIKLSAGDGDKPINLKIRDDVFNESAIVSDTIKLDTTLPVVTIIGPDVNKISKVSGKNASSFSFTVTEPFVEYKVCVVNSTGATESAGIVIGEANSSSGTSGTGSFDTSTTPMIVTIDGVDLELASSGDSQKIIKVFAKDSSGVWSV